VTAHVVEELSAESFRRLVAGGCDTAVVPFASIEHQGQHLPLGADAFVAEAVGRVVAERIGALLLPTLKIGDATQHAERPGTLSLSPETLSAAAFEIGGSLVRQGVRTVALVSTHGGNREALEQASVRLEAAHQGIRVPVPRGDLGANPGRHSGEWLTSVMLALRPELVHVEDAPSDLAEEVARADAARGRQHLERFIAAVVGQLTAVR
jgi:creatinine amidohydrolase